MTMNNERGKRWKAVTLDYDTLATYDDEKECQVCLTPRQSAALLSYMRGMEWGTRWVNLPDDFDLVSWVAEIEGRLIMCSCGNGSVSKCLCDLSKLIQQQLDLQVSLEVTLPDIPPNNPGENLPAINNPDIEQEERIDAYMCDLSKAWAATMGEMIYQSSLAYCQNDNDAAGIDWGLVATGVGVLLGAAAIGPGAIAVAAKALFVGSMVTGSLTIGAGFEQFIQNLFDGDCNTPNRIGSDVLNEYGCQLFSVVISDLTFDAWRDAFNQSSPGVISALEASGLSTSAAIARDILIRSALREYHLTGDGFQAFIISLNAAADNQYYNGSICDDCIDCDDLDTPIRSWSDSRISGIFPSPTLTENDTVATWGGGTWSVVIVRLDGPRCFTAFSATLRRGSTVAVPTAVSFTVAGNTVSDSSGGFGNGNISVAFSEWVSRYMVIKPGPGNNDAATLSLAIDDEPNNGIRTSNVVS